MLYIVISFIIILILILVAFGIHYRKEAGVCICENQINGKTVIITCGNTGTSRETALDLASRGAKIILACRDLEKAQKTKKAIIAQTGNENIVVQHLDFSDLYSVRKFSEDVLLREHRIDILINNCGSNFQARRESKQGFELTLCENFYGPFLLTNLLLQRIINSAPSRIINLTSLAHKSFHLDLFDLHFKKRNYNFYSSFAQSKLCNILFTKELSHRLVGKGVTVNALHPGFIQNEILTEKAALSSIVNLIGLITFKTPAMGAQSIIHLAVSDKLEKVTGEYFVDCKMAEPSKIALDPHLAKDLWELAEEDVGLHKEETKL